MTPRQNAHMDELLSRWHQWSQPRRKDVVRGFRNVAQGMEQYRTSRQYDDQNGALDDAIDDRISARVDEDVHQLPALERTAICWHAQALAVGRSVFLNPRLPADRCERAALVLRARDMLHKRLLASGVMQPDTAHPWAQPCPQAS